MQPPYRRDDVGSQRFARCRIGCGRPARLAAGKKSATCPECREMILLANRILAPPLDSREARQKDEKRQAAERAERMRARIEE
jgi:hypothetical protein